MALDEKMLRAAGLPASLISLLISIVQAGERAAAAANNAAIAIDLQPQIAAAVDAINQLGLAPGMDAQLAAIVQRLAGVDDAIANMPDAVDLTPVLNRILEVEQAVNEIPGPVDLTPLTDRIGAVETGLSDVAPPYDDRPVWIEINDLKNRVSGLDGVVTNRPPTSSPIPTQMLTVGTPFAATVSGYFDDPDGHALSVIEAVGRLPPGIERSGFDFSGTPTTTGNYTVTLIVADVFGAQTSRTIAWTVAPVVALVMSVTPAAGGIAVKNLGTFPDHQITTAVGGLTMELL